MTSRQPPVRQTPGHSGIAPPFEAGAQESHVLKKLSPKAAGTKRLTERYGKNLVCVRYREDLARSRRLTTVELIVDERPLPAPIAVRIAFDETELRTQVKAAGGVWDPSRKLWQLPAKTVRKLKLQQRVVAD